MGKRLELTFLQGRYLNGQERCVRKKKKLAFKTLEEKATHTAVRHFTSSRTANIEEKYMSKSQLEPSVEAGALILALEAGAGV